MKEKEQIRQLMRVTGYESPDLDYLLACMDQAFDQAPNEEDAVYSDVRISHY